MTIQPLQRLTKGSSVSQGEAQLPQEHKAQEYAKAFLQPLIERGDTVARMCQYPCVHACGMLYTVQIGGTVSYQGKRHQIGASQLVVKELDGQPCLFVFEVAELHAPDPVMQQLTLWEVSV